MVVVGHRGWFVNVSEKLQDVTGVFEVVIGRFCWFVADNRSLLVFIIVIVLLGQHGWFDGGSGCLWAVGRFFREVVTRYGRFDRSFRSLSRSFWAAVSGCG